MTSSKSNIASSDIVCFDKSAIDNQQVLPILTVFNHQVAVYISPKNIEKPPEPKFERIVLLSERLGLCKPYAMLLLRS